MKTPALLAGLAASLTLAAGCSQGTSGGSTGATTSTGSAATTTSVPASAPASRPAPPDGAAKVSLTDFAIAPATLTAKAGTVVLYVSNDGKTPHNLSLFDAAHKDAGHTADLKPGEAAVLKLQLAAGSYHIDCSLPGHESLGMTGTLTVS